MDTETEFWEYVDQSESCWLWTGATHLLGYGILNWRGSIERAHRLAYQFETGETPEEYVLHKCDVPGCVNPSHLYAGDQSDNMQDVWDRDRMPERDLAEQSGELNPSAKLSNAQVVEIRRKYSTGDVSQYDLAEEYNVKQPQISRIVNNSSWEDNDE